MATETEPQSPRKKWGGVWRDENVAPWRLGIILLLFPVARTKKERQKDVRHKNVLLVRSFCHASFCLLLKQEEEQEQKSSVRKMEKWLPKPTFHQSRRRTFFAANQAVWGAIDRHADLSGCGTVLGLGTLTILAGCRRLPSQTRTASDFISTTKAALFWGLSSRSLSELPADQTHSTPELLRVRC